MSDININQSATTNNITVPARSSVAPLEATLAADERLRPFIHSSQKLTREQLLDYSQAITTTISELDSLLPYHGYFLNQDAATHCRMISDWLNRLFYLNQKSIDRPVTIGESITNLPYNIPLMTEYIDTVIKIEKILSYTSQGAIIFLAVLLPRHDDTEETRKAKRVMLKVSRWMGDEVDSIQQTDNMLQRSYLERFLILSKLDKFNDEVRKDKDAFYNAKTSRTNKNKVLVNMSKPAADALSVLLKDYEKHKQDIEQFQAKHKENWNQGLQKHLDIIMDPEEKKAFSTNQNVYQATGYENLSSVPYEYKINKKLNILQTLCPHFGVTYGCFATSTDILAQLGDDVYKYTRRIRYPGQQQQIMIDNKRQAILERRKKRTQEDEEELKQLQEEEEERIIHTIPAKMSDILQKINDKHDWHLYNEKGVKKFFSVNGYIENEGTLHDFITNGITELMTKYPYNKRKTIDKDRKQRLNCQIDTISFVNKVFNIVVQVLAGLDIAQMEDSFTQFDMHRGNILLTLPKPSDNQTIKNLFYHYIFHTTTQTQQTQQTQRLSLQCEYSAVIIDFEYSYISKNLNIPIQYDTLQASESSQRHISGVDEESYKEAQNKFNIKSNKFNPNFDCYRLIVDVFIYITNLITLGRTKTHEQMQDYPVYLFITNMIGLLKPEDDEMKDDTDQPADNDVDNDNDNEDNNVIDQPNTLADFLYQTFGDFENHMLGLKDYDETSVIAKIRRPLDWIRIIKQFKLTKFLENDVQTVVDKSVLSQSFVWNDPELHDNYSIVMDSMRESQLFMIRRNLQTNSDANAKQLGNMLEKISKKLINIDKKLETVYALPHV
jgi:hypothetical protein